MTVERESASVKSCGLSAIHQQVHTVLQSNKRTAKHAAQDGSHARGGGMYLAGWMDGTA